MPINVILSIITINLNNSSGLKKTIDSVIPFLSNEIEFLILDGQSTDGSIELIKNAQQHLSYWISEKDAGIYAAMNNGIRRAKGKYVLFLNSGDMFLDDVSIQEVILLFNSNPDILSCCIQVETEDNKYVLRKPLEKFQKMEILLNCLPHQSTFIKRSLFLEHGFYDESFKIAADLEFWLRIVDHPIKYNHSSLVLSCMEKEGLGASKSATHFKERLRIFNMYSNGLKLNADYFKLLFRNRQLITWSMLTKLGIYS